MKKFLWLYFILSSSTWAQGQLHDKVLKLSNRINDRIYNEVYDLSKQQLRQVIKHLRQIRRTLNNHDLPLPPTNPPRDEIDARSVILAGVEASTSNESKGKSGSAGLQASQIYEMQNLAQACDVTQTWKAHAECVTNGLQNLRGYFSIDLLTTKDLIVSMCNATKTWTEDASCFSSAIDASQSDQLYNLAVGCHNISHSESQSKCYRSALQ